MAHWFVTAHGNAVNLDHARQIYVKEGRDGYYRVCAEFLVSTQSGQTASYSLVAGMRTESEADVLIPRIVSGEISDGMALSTRLMGDGFDMPTLEQVGPGVASKEFLGREY